MIKRQDFYKRIFGYQETSPVESRVIEKAVEKAKAQYAGRKAFSIEDLTDFWKISGISLRDEAYAVNLSKTLSPSKTQDEHAEQRILAEKAHDFYTPSFPELYAIISCLEQNKDNQKYQDEITNVRAFIKDSALKTWLMTLTRIQYNPQGEDIVIHNYKQPSQYELPVHFIGPDGAVLSADNSEKPVQALLDTNQSLQEVNEAFRWLMDVDAYIWRLNSKPQQTDERVAGFVAYSRGVSLSCGRDSHNPYSALRVSLLPAGPKK